MIELVPRILQLIEIAICIVLDSWISTAYARLSSYGWRSLEGLWLGVRDSRASDVVKVVILSRDTQAEVMMS